MYDLCLWQQLSIVRKNGSLLCSGAELSIYSGRTPDLELRLLFLSVAVLWHQEVLSVVSLHRAEAMWTFLFLSYVLVAIVIVNNWLLL